MVQRSIRFVQHRDVFLILPTGAAVTARVEETQERKRIHVIGAPRSAHEAFEVELGLGVEKSLPLHVPQAHRYAKILFPLRLHPLGKRSVLRLRVEDELDLFNWKRRT